MIINIASSSLTITSNAWISILLSDEESAKAFSIKYIFENIGAMIGPVLGTFFIAVDPRFPFFIAAVSLCITIIVFGLYSKPLHKGIKNEKAIPSEGVKKTFRLLIRDKSLLYFTIGGIFSMMIYGALVTFMSLFFSVTYSYEIAYQKVAYISVLNAVIVLSIQYFVSAVIKKDTIMKWIRFAIISMIIGLMILMYNTNFIFMTVAILLLSFGEVVIVPAEYLFIIKITPENKRGLYLGAQNLIYLGLSFSPIICGFMLEKFAPQWMLLFLAVLLGLSLFFYSLGYVKSEKISQVNLNNRETNIN
jgi:predicted MFS family arabinose efflux permease